MSKLSALSPEPVPVAQAKASILLSQENTNMSLSHERAHIRAGAGVVKEFLHHRVILLDWILV